MFVLIVGMSFYLAIQNLISPDVVLSVIVLELKLYT